MTTPSQLLTSPQPIDDVSPVGSATNRGRFSRLHLAAASPDWMAPLSQSHPAYIASTGAGNRSGSTSETSAPAPVGVTVAPRAPGFLGLFCRGSNRGDAKGAEEPPAEATLRKAPLPPAVIGGAVTPTLQGIVVPVDAAFPLDSAGTVHSHALKGSLIRPERAGPLTIGSDTWNALGTASLPRARPLQWGSGKAVAHHPVAPPSIDSQSVSAIAPKPLWSDLPAALEHRGTSTSDEQHRIKAPEPLGAPTLEAFRPVKRVPEPPMPITTSPLREPDTHPAASHPTVVPRLIPADSTEKPISTTALFDALRPVGEEDGVPAAAPTRREPTRGNFFRGAQVARPSLPAAAAAAAGPTANPFAGLTFATTLNNDSDSNSDDEGPTLPLNLTALNTASSKPDAFSAPSQPQLHSAAPGAETQRGGNVQDFFSSLFSAASPTTAATKEEEAMPVESPSTAAPASTVSKSATARLTDALMNFNVLELAIGGGRGGRRKDVASARAKGAVSAPTAAHQSVDYSSFFGTAFDELEEDSEESLDQLKRVVSIVLQSARQQQQAEEGSAGCSSAKPADNRNNGGNRGAFFSGGGASGLFTAYTGGSSGAAGGVPQEPTGSTAEWRAPLETPLFQGM